MMTHIAEHESAQHVRIGYAVVQREQRIERLQRLFILTALIEHFGQVQARHRLVRVCIARAVKPSLRAPQIARALFKQTAFQQRGGVVGVFGNQCVKFLRRLGVPANEAQQSRLFPTRNAIVRIVRNARR
ncbi:MAG: hypothetical protein M3Y64_01525, partial [Gemmatimonadota bacterium]|nr:hypothetical protein [Gemmatimonadota bacterium]